jgi:hypothetical protein
MSRIFTAMLALVLVSVTVSAHASGWSPQVTITSLQADTNGYVYLTTSPQTYNPDSCTNLNELLISDTTYKFVVATLIAAQISGQSVALYYNGCTSNYPNITAVSVPNI